MEKNNLTRGMELRNLMDSFNTPTSIREREDACRVYPNFVLDTMQNTPTAP